MTPALVRLIAAPWESTANRRPKAYPQAQRPACMASAPLRQVMAILALMGVLSGCAAERRFPVPPLSSPYRPVELDATTQGQDAVASFVNYSATALPQNTLVLSGGGMYGAYTSGVLAGWSQSGARPTFDVVTGISTGALIAPFAFLGSEYDSELARLYTSMHRDDIFRLRPFWGESVASSEPLEQQIRAGATPEVLKKIANAHRQGRRLYVGTTNLDTKRLVIWDLGEIAARDTSESRSLFQKILLASCSVPGLFPPVAIDIKIDGKNYTELHADGSIAAYAFLLAGMLGVDNKGNFSTQRERNIYVIVAGLLEPKATPARRELLSISSESMNALLQSKLDGDLTRIFALAKFTQAKFLLAGVDQRDMVSESSMSFDPHVMRRLFQAGYQGGKDGTAWHPIPPSLTATESSLPRSGVRFVSGSLSR